MKRRNKKPKEPNIFDSTRKKNRKRTQYGKKLHWRRNLNGMTRRNLNNNRCKTDLENDIPYFTKRH